MQSHLNMTTTKGGGFKDYNKKKRGEYTITEFQK